MIARGYDEDDNTATKEEQGTTGARQSEGAGRARNQDRLQRRTATLAHVPLRRFRMPENLSSISSLHLRKPNKALKVSACHTIASGMWEGEVCQRLWIGCDAAPRNQPTCHSSTRGEQRRTKNASKSKHNVRNPSNWGVVREGGAIAPRRRAHPLCATELDSKPRIDCRSRTLIALSKQKQSGAR